MTEQAESSRRWLRSLCRAGTIAGWVLIACFPLGVCRLLTVQPMSKAYVFHNCYLATKEYILAGFLVLGAVQFVRYLSDLDHEPRKLLRSFHLVLFALAVGVLIYEVIYAGMIVRMAVGSSASVHRISLVYVVFLMGFLPGLAQALILAGTGLAIRLALPIIAESKTLA